PLVAHVTHEATRAVAAMLHFAAVRVEDPIVEVGAGRARRLDQQELVAADPEMAVGDAPDPGRVELDFLVDGVEHDEVVARTLHLGEVDFQWTETLVTSRILSAR